MPKVPPASPPKRMTRARAKAVEEKQQTQVITTAGAKAASAAASNTTAKRKTRSDDEPNKDVLEKTQPAKPQPKRTTRGKAKVQASEEPAEEERPIPEPKTRSRGRPTTARNETTASTARTTNTASKRTTRGNTNSQQPARPATHTATTRKKVTFQDEQEADKENNIVETKQPIKVERGIVAEKGTATTAQARKGEAAPTRRGPNRTKPGLRTTNAPRGEPLSPKKATQVAKATQKEDDIVVSTPGPSSPVKLLGQSPQKIPTPFSTSTQAKQDSGTTSEEHPDSPVDELQLPSVCSPVKQSVRPLAGSPPKRLPQSPFKDALKESPKKLNLGTPATKTLMVGEPQLQASSSLAQSPARKPPSPIKLFRDGPSNPGKQTPATVAKTSLLQTPARRPPSSVKPLHFPVTAPKPVTSGLEARSTPSALRQSPQKFKLPFTTTPSKVVAETLSSTSPHKLEDVPSEKGEKIMREELFKAPSLFTLKPSPTCEDQAATQVQPATEDDAHFLGCESEKPSAEGASKTITEPIEGENERFPPLAEDEEFSSPCILEQQETLSIADTPPKSLQMRSSKMQWSPAGESEDELMSEDPKYLASPSKRSEDQSQGPIPCSTATPASKISDQSTDVSMTGLAERFGAWTGATPDTRVLQQRKNDGFVFSPSKQQPKATKMENSDALPSPELAEVQPNSFMEAMEIHEDPDEPSEDELNATEDIFRRSLASEASQEHADENDIPIDPALLRPTPQVSLTCTPQRVEGKEPQVLHTVSKVPLKAAADIEVTPKTKANATKRRSVTTALTPRADVELEALRQVYPPLKQPTTIPSAREPFTTSEMDNDDGSKAKRTPSEKSTVWSVVATPARTPRPDLNKRLLNGAIVFVDVHTSEGADASGLFIDLLQQMGASVRGSWNWNPEKSEENENDENDSRPGITHVVFKDGGKRTMEKFRATRGIVMCVGVGWVLE